MGIKLEIGSGEYPRDGYIHMDARRGLPCQEIQASILDIPLEPNTVSEILAVMIIEHLYAKDVSKALGECIRILEPGGIIKIYVPHFLHLLENFTLGEKTVEDLLTWVYGGQDYLLNTHVSGYTPKILKGCLENAGFTISYIEATQGLYMEAVK